MTERTEPSGTLAGAGSSLQQARRIRQLNALPPVEVSGAVDAGVMLRQLDELRQRILSAYPMAVSEDQVMGSIMRKLQEPPGLPGSVNDDSATGCHQPAQLQGTALNEEMVRNIVREEVRKLTADEQPGPSDEVCTQGLNPGAPERRNRHERIEQTESPTPIPVHPHHHHSHDSSHSKPLTHELSHSNYEWGLTTMRSKQSVRHSHHSRHTSPDARDRGAARSREVSPHEAEKTPPADLCSIPENQDTSDHKVSPEL